MTKPTKDIMLLLGDTITKTNKNSMNRNWQQAKSNMDLTIVGGSLLPIEAGNH